MYLESCHPPGAAILTPRIFQPSFSSISSPSTARSDHLPVYKPRGKSYTILRRKGEDKASAMAPLSGAKSRKFSSLKKIYSASSSLISKGMGDVHLGGDMSGRKKCTGGSGVELFLNDAWLHQTPNDVAPLCKGVSPEPLRPSRLVDESNGRKIVEMGVAMGLDLDKGNILEKIVESEVCDHTRAGEMDLQKVDQ